MLPVRQPTVSVPEPMDVVVVVVAAYRVGVTRVLVVDDDFMVAKLHGRYVSAMDGFTVVGVAHSGADALRAARRLRPDLVLLDIYLPDMDGIAVLRELRAAEERSGDTRSADALFITAARDAGVVRAALRAGALHYLIKPFHRSALEEQLHHVASLRNRLDALDEARQEARQEDVDRIFGTRPPARANSPRGSRRAPRTWWNASCARTRPACPPPSAPRRVPCPASARAAISSTSRKRGGPRCRCGTGGRGGRSAATARCPDLAGRARPRRS